MTPLSPTLQKLKLSYVELHERKEDLFWSTKMGLVPNPQEAQKALARAEIELNRFLQDPSRLRELRWLLRDGSGSEQERRILEGWIATFAARTIEDSEARKLSEQLVELEGDLQHARVGMELTYLDPASGERVAASINALTLMMRADPDEARRRAAFEAMRTVETFVLEHGFLDIVRMRNKIAKLQGYEDYYDWRVHVAEGIRKRDVFAKLDELVRRTEDRTQASLRAFEQTHGAGAREPWNFHFLRSGQTARDVDAYFPLAPSLRRWGRSFQALGVKFRGATLTLDLVDRPGKYENGFMHGPGLAFLDTDGWHPARINFTANAVPGAVGAGQRAAETLFHEGGHAAHFANITMPAPCFSHEFEPTSVAYAETQSMFMDALLGDADWRVRYALDRQGRPMPLELIERTIRESQPLRGWDIRAMVTVPLAERRIYELADDELTPERVLEEVRAVERQTQGLTAGVRPVLAVPHLLAGEASAYYHAYTLAEMAVYQTREFFLKRDGYLTDNPAIGPDLAEHYWRHGNAVSFDDTLRSLTGQPLRADALVACCNQTVDEALEEAREAVRRSAERPIPEGRIDLDATVRVIHGPEVVATTEGHTFEDACEAFERWADAQEAAG